MKAAVYRKYGAPDVVRVLEVPTPEAKAGQVLIRIHATTISAADWRARSLDMPRGFGLIGRFVFGVFGPRKPVLGLSFSGEIVAIGDGVTRFAVGDAVLGDTARNAHFLQSGDRMQPSQDVKNHLLGVALHRCR